MGCNRRKRVILFETGGKTITLASIQKIVKVEKHPNADKLDIVTVLGWKCITKLGNSMEECLEQAKGKSAPCDRNREGLVLRNYDKNISFKIINNDFLLEED